MNPWRVVERFELTGVTEHGPCSLLIYNTHQPKAKGRPFNNTQQIDFGKAALEDATQYNVQNEINVGYGFGGDANCSTAIWAAAFHETSLHQLTFTQPFFMYGVNRKPGDVMVISCWQRRLELP